MLKTTHGLTTLCCQLHVVCENPKSSNWIPNVLVWNCFPLMLFPLPECLFPPSAWHNPHAPGPAQVSSFLCCVSGPHPPRFVLLHAITVKLVCDFPTSQVFFSVLIPFASLAFVSIENSLFIQKRKDFSFSFESPFFLWIHWVPFHHPSQPLAWLHPCPS